MARLHAHGYELARLEKETIPQAADDLCIWERVTYAFMSDRRILRKFDVRFKPSQYEPQGHLHSYGWKLNKKFKDTVNLAEAVQSIVDQLKTKGFKQA